MIWQRKAIEDLSEHLVLNKFSVQENTYRIRPWLCFQFETAAKCDSVINKIRVQLMATTEFEQRQLQ